MSSVKIRSANPIPILDLGPFLDGSSKEEFAKEMLESFQTFGFVYVVNHGLPQDKISSMFEWSRKFFAQPLEVKQLAPHPASGSPHRGYSAPGREKVSKLANADGEAVERPDRSAGPLDMKESFEAGAEDNETEPNIWLPDGVLPGFKEACLDFYWACREIELKVLRALAIGLKLSEEYLVNYHNNPGENQLRLLHYPSVPADDLATDKVTRIGEHTDFCTLTLLLQDDIGGLQVEDPNNPGSFLNVSPVEGAICINAGDFLMRWSNDTIRSTVHRVRAPATKIRNQDGMIPARYSIPYFCATNMQTVVDCLPGTFSETRPKKYKPISAGAYIMERLAAAY